MNFCHSIRITPNTNYHNRCPWNQAWFVVRSIFGWETGMITLSFCPAGPPSTPPESMGSSVTEPHGRSVYRSRVVINITGEMKLRWHFSNSTFLMILDGIKNIMWWWNGIKTCKSIIVSVFVWKVVDVWWMLEDSVQ